MGHDGLQKYEVIHYNLENVFSEGELEEESNVHFLHNANSDKPIMLYSLDVIISVDYHVKYQFYLKKFLYIETLSYLCINN